MSDTEDEKQQVDVLPPAITTAQKRKKNNKTTSSSANKDDSESHLLETAKLNAPSKKKDGPKKKGKPTNTIEEDSTQVDGKKQPAKKAAGKKGDITNENDEGNNVNSQKELVNPPPPPAKGAKKEGKAAGKQAKLSASDYQLLLEYMRDANKPFNSTTLESNLKTRSTLKKATLELALIQAVEEGQLTKKAYGSTAVFWYNQDLLPVVNKEEIEKLTESTLQRQQEFSEINLSLRAANSALSKIMAEKTDEQLINEIARLTELHAAQEEKLLYYTGEQFIPEEQAVVVSVEDRLSKIESTYKKRKRMCEDTVRNIIESLEENKTLQQMFEIIGIDDPLLV